jgi:hypothetical protein
VSTARQSTLHHCVIPAQCCCLHVETLEAAVAGVQQQHVLVRIMCRHGGGVAQEVRATVAFVAFVAFVAAAAEQLSAASSCCWDCATAATEAARGCMHDDSAKTVLHSASTCML